MIPGRTARRTDPTSPVYSENGTDTDADGDIESAWFTSNVAGMTATPGHLTQATVTGSTSWQTYFTPEATPVTLANIGDSMKLTWVFNMANVANDPTNNTGQNFRLAIVDSPSANRLTTDGTPGTQRWQLQWLRDVHEHRSDASPQHTVPVDEA